MKKYNKKTISILIAAIVIFSMVFSLGAGCNIGYGREFERVIEGDFIVLDFFDGEKELYIEGLSEEGKQKEIIVVPEFLRGKVVTGFGHSISNGGPSNAKWVSEKLEKVYIKGLVKSGHLAIDNNNGCPNLKKVIFIVQIDDISNYGTYAPDYFSQKWHEKNESVRFGIANISYYWNYEGSPNNGYYWLDDIDYGTKITFVPENPVREGFVFGGWFKEAECVNQWNFETDTIPQEIKDGNNKTVYQETILYAKWIAA